MREIHSGGGDCERAEHADDAHAGRRGHYRLQFNATLRKAARADVGDVVGVELRIDREPRDLPVPPELERAMKRRPLLRKEFEGLPPGWRMQFLRFLNAKAPATREKRIRRAIQVLLERALPRPRGNRI